MIRRALVAAVLALGFLAAPAAAHGAPTMQQKEFGDLAATYHTFTEINAQEWVRLGWVVSDKASGEAKDLTGTTVTFTFLAEDGSTASTETMQLEARNERYTADLFLVDAAALESTFDVDGQAITFTQDIAPAAAEDSTSPPPEEETNESPGAGALAALAAAGLGAALIARRGGRRRA